MGKACSIHTKDGIYVQNFGRKTEGRDHFENLGVDVQIILKIILKK
jgi:hypothetical protein